MASSDAPTSSSRLTLVAALLAAAAVVVMLVLASVDHDGAGWILQPVLGLAAAATAWRAGGTSPRNRLAFAALIVGILMALIFLGFLIAEA
jgi:hypothetical protein